ncbi:MULTISPECIES: hypothetical protein [unclassified Rhizobium]|uniref:hypothetical protein n=1 Tax=unclassified Rhizobium TaxID=2613769 RepID=UPI001C8293F0|nr:MULTISPECIES: hypothetical protein [unclassified Rhizobium]MBX5222489.1 hypothetical protein [Rhizobium sp. NLR8a]MBX5227791.1 hypothetical protein [Rhizobium sp. NLR9b]MBX5242504.1 hypothetical protein [Rhizobium sp. NLR22b]MBX5269508.1 hypothetical protein [Rhizobium sp. NLR17b]MBX5288835.1 hypothetical protein [Rhizobium sp. NLR10b]
MRKENISNSIQQNAVAAISAAHLLHPAKHFGHPRDVLAAAEIDNDEKRAILASWASDIFAVESVPALRLYPGAERAVSYDEILEALKALDNGDRPSARQDTSASLSSHRTRRRKPPTPRFPGLCLCSYWKGGRRRPLFET